MRRVVLFHPLLGVNRQLQHCIRRQIYSGDESAPDRTRNSLHNDKTWEAEKLKRIQERVALIGEGVNFEGDDKIIDEETKKIRDLPHLVYLNQSEVEKTKDFAKNVLGNRLNFNKVQQVTRKTNIDPDFEREEVQLVLKAITGCDTKRVFRTKLGVPSEMPTIKYLTTEQLKKEVQKSLRDAEKLLEMPPVMLQREEINEIIAEDESLDGYENCNVVFADISENLKLNERFMVVREPTGRLRKAKWEERDRVQQTYFSKLGRTAIKPKLFENLEIAFENNLHQNVLMQVLVQYEPDSAEYIQIHADVYNDIDCRGIYDDFRSSRFFGGLAFYLVKYKSIDGLLIDMIKRSLISDAVNLIRMFCMLHPTSKTASALEQKPTQQELDTIEAYMNSDCQDAHKLKLAIETSEALFKSNHSSVSS